MTLQNKFKKIFESGYSFSFQNVVKRMDGEWESRITWTRVQLPMGNEIKSCKWEGFEEIEDCVDDCLKYIDTL